MEKQKSPKGFIVMLPEEIIEIPQDSDKSWLILFYSLPRELAERWKPAYELPHCPYEVLRTDKYDHHVCMNLKKLAKMKVKMGLIGDGTAIKTLTDIIFVIRIRKALLA